MADFDWDDMRHFAALAATLHLGRAARHLHTSDATVLRRVRNLENRLGARFFVRRKTGHQLTAEGKRLAILASDMNASALTVKREIAGKNRALRGRVRVATTEVGAEWILAPRLPDFVAKWPEISLEIESSPSHADLLAEGEIVALRFARPTQGDFTIRKLGALEFAPFASRAFLTQRKAPPDARLDPQWPYLGWASHLGEIGLARWFRRNFGERLPVASLTSMRAQMVLARLGLGVAALPCFAARREIDLVRLTPVVEEFVLDAWLVVPTQIRRSTRVMAVAKFVEDAFRAALKE